MELGYFEPTAVKPLFGPIANEGYRLGSGFAPNHRALAVASSCATVLVRPVTAIYNETRSGFGIET